MTTATSSLDLLDRQRMLNNFDAAVYGMRTYLTQWIHSLVLESELLHKIVNLLFTITN